ncbi:MAG: hypothetical protein ABEJ64_04515 [Candidatus Nanohaloarchaea archaeon]
MKFEAIVLTTTGDYLVEEESQLHQQEKGIELDSPHVINEEEKAQEVQAETVFVPYSSVENVQHGEFEQETV